MTAERGAQRQPESAKWGLASLALSMLLASLGVSIANVALPTLERAFAAPFQGVQWVVLSYLLAVTIMSVTVGRFGDALGRRRILLTGIALFSLASILCGAAPNLTALVLARAVQGLGGAVLMALTVALVSETVARERTGSAMGLLGTTSAIGTALGPSLGGLLIAGVGWRAIFFVMAPLGLLNLLIAGRHLPEDRPRGRVTRADFDGWGTLILGLTLAGYGLAMTIGRGRFGTINLALLAAAVLGAGVFWLIETKAAAPLVRLAALRHPPLSAGLAMNGLVATVMMATLVVGPFYLSRALGLGEAEVGLIMAIGPIVSILSGIPAGRIVDRAGAGLVLLVGLAEMAAGALALATVPTRFGVAGYIAAIVVLTPGYQLFQAANNTSLMKDVGKDQRGVVSGMLSLARNLGLITGASVMGALFAAAARTGEVANALPDAVSTGMRTTFAVAAGLIAIALVLAVASRARVREAPLLENQP